MLFDKAIRAFAYQLYKSLLEGHICLTREGWEANVSGISELFPEADLDWATLSEHPAVGHSEALNHPFIIEDNRLYFQRYYKYERSIIDRISAFNERSLEQKDDYEERLRSLAPFLNQLYGDAMPEGIHTDWQMVATICALLNDFCIITGGPGTGKTTTVARVLALFLYAESKLRVALAAPTGKAAARMLESLKNASAGMSVAMQEDVASLEPFTIHRLLGFIPQSSRFRHNKNNPLPYDLIIVDESSMLDAALFAKLLDAVGQGSRLILLGDKDQLASVEAGSLFGDLCLARGTLNSFTEDQLSLINSLIVDEQRRIGEQHRAPHLTVPAIVELRYSRRFTGNTGIGLFSKAVINNDEKSLQRFLSENDDQVQLDHSYSSLLFADFVSGFEEYLLEEDLSLALKKLNKLRVLCATREGEYGLSNLNRRIEAILEQKGLLRANSLFYENRPVMVTSNNYSVGVFNGDIGIVRKDEFGEMKVWFEDGSGALKPVMPGYIAHAETAFAMTIHKSQGSEFDKVLVVLPQKETTLLTRELLYTAVTRARSYVLLQATADTIMRTSATRVSRASGIAGGHRTNH